MKVFSKVEMFAEWGEKIRAERRRPGQVLRHGLSAKGGTEIFMDPPKKVLEEWDASHQNIQEECALPITGV